MRMYVRVRSREYGYNDQGVMQWMTPFGVRNLQGYVPTKYLATGRKKKLT